MRKRIRSALTVAAVVAATGACVWSAESGRFILNLTESMPVGLYSPIQYSRAKPGDIVVFCPPEREPFVTAVRRGYLSRSNGACAITPLMKIVAAGPGDRAVISRSGIIVNGKPIPGTEQYPNDPSGRPLPRYKFDGVLKKSEYFVTTPQKMSFDSRYFGKINENQIITKVKPILTLNLTGTP